MELTPTGRLVLWLEVSLLAVGIFLSDTPILLSSAFLFLCLLFEGASFQRAVNRFKHSIRLESCPSAIETAVGRPFKVETVVTNASRSRFSIVRFSHSLPSQIGEEVHVPPRLVLHPHGKQQIETILETKNPGRFEITTSTILVERRGHLFSQAVTFPDEIVIIGRPLISRSVLPIETGVLTDLAVDHLRRGTGTDLAGVRPFNTRDDFHSIDWKATARRGKLMTKESYLDKDPTVMLMVDASFSTSAGMGDSSIIEELLNEAGNLLAAIRPVSPVGLILYDEQSVIENIEARGGESNRERILCTLLEKTKNTPVGLPLSRPAIRTVGDFAKETNALRRKSTIVAKTKAQWERFLWFASFVLPFYDRATSKYFERLGRQGIFKAFQIVCSYPEPVLLIVITDGHTNLEGLVEGAKNARRLNHQIILGFLAARGTSERTSISSALERQGVGSLRCKPEELTKAINAEIAKLGHSRTILGELTGWK